MATDVNTRPKAVIPKNINRTSIKATSVRPGASDKAPTAAQIKQRLR